MSTKTVMEGDQKEIATSWQLVPYTTQGFDLYLYRLSGFSPVNLPPPTLHSTVVTTSSLQITIQSLEESMKEYSYRIINLATET